MYGFPSCLSSAARTQKAIFWILPRGLAWSCEQISVTTIWMIWRPCATSLWEQSPGWELTCTSQLSWWPTVRASLEANYGQAEVPPAWVSTVWSCHSTYLGLLPRRQTSLFRKCSIFNGSIIIIYIPGVPCDILMHVYTMQWLSWHNTICNSFVVRHSVPLTGLLWDIEWIVISSSQTTVLTLTIPSPEEPASSWPLPATLPTLLRPIARSRLMMSLF